MPSLIVRPTLAAIGLLLFIPARQNRGLARWDDHLVCQTGQLSLYRFIDRLAIIGAVRHKPSHRTIDLIQKLIDLVGINGILVGQKMRDDHAGFHVETNVELLSAMAFSAMLGAAPLALAKDFQPHAVQNQIQRL